jgi:hypothetical protein
MIKRVTLALLMVGTLTVGGLGVASTADAQWFARRPYYTYYSAPSYSYYYAQPYGGYYAPFGYRTYYRPYSYYVTPPFGSESYYTARPGIQVYYR